MQVGVGKRISLLEDVDTLEDPEEEALNEAETDDELNGNELVDGLQVGHVLLELDGNKEDRGNAQTGRDEDDNVEPESGKVGLALILAVDVGDLGDDGGNQNTKRDERVLEDCKASLLRFVSFF